jgi:hypothetical protein
MAYFLSELDQVTLNSSNQESTGELDKDSLLY